VALSWKQIVDPSLSVAIFAQNGVYGLFAATFVPVLLGIFTRSMARGWIFAASATAIVVHFGMYYGEITMYHNNPAVPATFAIGASLVVGLLGLAVGRKAPPDADAAAVAETPGEAVAAARADAGGRA
jgi:sodium/pantothenate symporter